MIRLTALAARFAAALLALGVLGSVTAAHTASATEVTRLVTPAGIEVWYTREPTIPIISVNLAFRGGTALDPAGKEGLATLAMGLLDEGAGTLDSLAFQRAVTNRAIRLGFDAGRDAVVASLTTISKHRREAFRYLGLALRTPRFEADAVERVRRQLLSGIAADEKDPQSIAFRTWFDTVLPDHPYGTPQDGTADSVSAITIDDLRGFARGRLARSNVYVGAAGDIPPEEIAALIDRALAALPAEAAPFAIADASLVGLGETVVKRMPIPQSVVSFGMPGLKRNDPDFYAAYVMNHVLGGGGFTSRLYEEVREKRGLAYSVYSFLQPLDSVGLYLGGAATSNARVAQSIDIIRAEIARLATDGVTDAELDDAKRHLTGAFPLRFDNGSKIARLLVSMQLDDLGIDYIDRRNGLINAVGHADIMRVAGRLLDPALLTMVVVGAPEGLEVTP